ncbi:beta-hexosaminidase subunit beta-like [Discoglossus pictus]
MAEPGVRLQHLVAVSLLMSCYGYKVPRGAGSGGPNMKGRDSSYGSLWPLPRNIQMFPRTKYTPPTTFRFVHAPESTVGPTCLLIEDAFRRYYEYIFGYTQVQKHPKIYIYEDLLVQLQIKILSQNHECDQYPSMNSDESYELVVGEYVAFLQANQVWGALRVPQVLRTVPTWGRAGLSSHFFNAPCYCGFVM